MDALAFAVVAFGILGFGLVSARAERGWLTPPMAFVAFGFLVGQGGGGLIEFTLDDELVHLLAEVALLLILFADASRIDLRSLWREHRVPLRLLSLGLPLTVLAGTAAAMLLFPGMAVWSALLLAIVLAPTDAALGQSVVSSPEVPVRIRQSLNVESGLNDGIALPLLLIALSLASAEMGNQGSVPHWLGFAAAQILLGPAVGGAVGYVGARLLQRAYRAGWVSDVFLKLSAIGLALLGFGAAELVHGNGFIAAFAAGLALGNVARDICPRVYEFGEAEGQLLALLTFMIFGGLMVPRMFAELTPAVVAYAAASLTVLRMLPVAVSLIGTGLKPVSIVFLGWFGPRGIASILYTLLIVQQAHVPSMNTIVATVTLTVLASVLLHGISAHPAANGYAAVLKRRADPAMAEHEAVAEMPLRLRGARSASARSTAR